MGIPFAAIARAAVRVIAFIVPAVRAVETIGIAIPTLKGKAKQDAAVDAIRGFVEASETVLGRDLLNDAEVEAAVRHAIDAVVALQNIVAKKAAAPSA